MGSAVSFFVGVWGKAPAAIALDILGLKNIFEAS